MLVAAIACCVALWVGFALIVTWSLGRQYRAAVKFRESMKLDRALPRTELAVASDVERFCVDGPATPPETFLSSLGLRIFVYSWPPSGAYAGKRPKAIILYNPGLDTCGDVDLCRRGRLRDRVGYVGSWINCLCERGFLVYSYDYSGMGRSDGVAKSWGTWPSLCFDYEDYVDEALQVAFLVRTRHPGLRVVAFGGSMGACVGLNAVERHPERFDLCVFFCPAVSFEKLKKLKQNKVLLPLLGVLSKLVPWLPLGEKAVDDAARLQEEIDVGRPAFHTGKLRTRYAEHGIAFGERAVSRAGRITHPLLILHAKDDEFADYLGAELLMAAAATTDKTLIDDLDGFGHGLTACDSQFLDNKFCKMIVHWIDARLLLFDAADAT